jgi:hypothetical protein
MFPMMILYAMNQGGNSALVAYNRLEAIDREL